MGRWLIPFENWHGLRMDIFLVDEQRIGHGVYDRITWQKTIFGSEVSLGNENGSLLKRWPKRVVLMREGNFKSATEVWTQPTNRLKCHSAFLISAPSPILSLL